MEPAREHAHAAEPQPGPPAAQRSPSGSGVGNRALGALVARDPSALARIAAARSGGNRAIAALVQRKPPRTTADMHEEIYGDSSLAHGSGPAPSAAETDTPFSDDPLAEGGFGPNDPTIRVKPGPVRTTLIKPKLDPPPSREWLEEALKRDKLLKELPPWAREKAIDALKDADELAAEKIIDALPWDDKTKAAATAAIKAVLQLAKGRTFKPPPAPPATRQPDWRDLPEPPKAPGETIFMLPPIKW